HLGARPDGSAPGGGAVARLAGQVQPDLSVYQPRPGGSQSTESPVDGGQAGTGCRTRACRDDLRRTATPLYAAAAGSRLSGPGRCALILETGRGMTQWVF